MERHDINCPSTEEDWDLEGPTWTRVETLEHGRGPDRPLPRHGRSQEGETTRSTVAEIEQGSPDSDTLTGVSPAGKDGPRRVVRSDGGVKRYDFSNDFNTRCIPR